MFGGGGRGRHAEVSPPKRDVLGRYHDFKLTRVWDMDVLTAPVSVVVSTTVPASYECVALVRLEIRALDSCSSGNEEGRGGQGGGSVHLPCHGSKSAYILTATQYITGVHTKEAFMLKNPG